jgi:hypothetical protein
VATLTLASYLRSKSRCRTGVFRDTGRADLHIPDSRADRRSARRGIAERGQPSDGRAEGQIRVEGSRSLCVGSCYEPGRVVAAGRKQQVLSTLHLLGADAIIRLDASAKELGEAFMREAGQAGFQVVIDYVWGSPAEAFLAAIIRKEFGVITSETRFVQVGESAGPTISLPAAVLRSTALTILGTAGIPPRNVLVDA